MSITDLTPAEIMERGRAALLKELGPVGYVRFLQQIAPGKGNYTQERREWVDKLSVEDIRRLINERRKL